jgi:serine/threonine-protein kinase
MTDVFVSYKAEDRARIAPLVRALETGGVSVWWDAHIGGGDDWRQTILRHLEAAKCVIVVWSKRSVGPHGEFVRDEAARALKRKTYLPVRIDKVDPPLGFGEMQALDLAAWKGDTSDPRYEAVVTALRSRFGIKAKRSHAESIEVKGVDRRMLIAGGSVAAVAIAGGGAWFALRPTAAKSNSIAVLPFENLSGDPSQTYFSDGIAEELRGDLSRVSGLQVIARTSSEAMRNADAKTAAAKLGVVNILTGSVRRSPSVIRISAELIDGRQGVERWSQTYDRAPGDSLQIQTDIASKVADALRLQLGDAGRNALAQGGTSNAAAQDLLLKARALLNHDEQKDGVEQALGLVNAALALDPKYADAVAFKAKLQTLLAGMFASSAAESQRGYQVAKATAEEAISLAPRCRLGYSALAAILDQQLYLRAALQQYQKMLALPGSDADLVDFAVNQSEWGHFDEALQLINRAIAADPLNPQSYGWKAYILANARRYSDAAATVQLMMVQEPGSLWGRSFHAYCLMMLGNNAAARREFDAIGNDALRGAPAYLGALAARQGDTALLGRVFGGLHEHSNDAAYYQFAEIYAQQGSKNQAVVALEKAWAARDPGLSEMLVDPLLDPIRNDSGFQALVKKLDFPT